MVRTANPSIARDTGLQLTRGHREWIVVFSFFGQSIVVLFRMAYIVERKRRSKLANSAVQVDPTLYNEAAFVRACEENDPAWLAFAEGRFMTEGCRFISSVATLRRYFDDRSIAWRVRLIGQIFELFLRSDAPFECNVSHASRQKAAANAQAVKTGAKPPWPEVFDEPFHEMVQMLLHGTWYDFLKFKAVKSARGGRGTTVKIDGKISSARVGGESPAKASRKAMPGGPQA